MADEDPIRIPIETPLDEQSTQRSLSALERIMGQSRIGQRLAERFQKTFTAGAGQRAFDPLAASAEATRKPLADLSRRLQDLNADTDALNRRTEATRKTLNQVGAEPELFAVIDRELKKVLATAREFNSDLERISRDPELVSGYETSLNSAQRLISREVAALQTELRNLAQVQKIEGDRTNALLKGQQAEKIEVLRSARSRFVAETQREGAQTLAETRIAGQRQVQAERQTQRTRIELLRFTLNQVRVIERGIAATFRATAAVISGAYARVEGAVVRIGRVLTRSNREMNDGLRGALRQRESTIDRSFQRQTQEIRQATARQSRILQQFEAQSSRGLAGLATGRSGLGALVGGGAAIGGGFLIARQLREGFEETVNLNESLNKTRQIFGAAGDEIVAFSENSVDALFVTQATALEAASNFGIFGKAAGLAGSQLADFSTDLSLLATDLASFNNTSIEDATTAISAALRGESEPIRRYGVLLNEAVLQQRAYSLGITETIRKLQPFERVLAANAEIFAQTADQQGDAARTADDFANSSRRAGAALTETFAALARFAIPIATVITNGALPALQGLTRFIEGDTTPALRIVRDAIIGASIALAGLLAARVAGEAFQFLTIAVRGLLTPMGLFIGLVAGIGAGIRIFSQRSERFAAGVDSVASALRSFAGRGLERALDGLERLRDIAGDVVLPALQRLASTLAGPLFRALELAVGFVVVVAIPALLRLGEIIGDNVVPAAVAIGRTFTNVVIPAVVRFAQVALGALQAVGRFIAPAVDGFLQLGDAIRQAFVTGDFTGLLGGLAAVGRGIGTVFGNLGVLIFEALQPQVLRAVGFLSRAFDRIDFAAIGSKILEVVRLVGFVLGSIVSDPLFVQALEGIVAAAVLLGGNFIVGFGQGVASNLPELGRLLKSQLGTAFSEAIKFAFDNPTLIAGVLAAALVAPAVLRAYSAAGAAGARGLFRGFVGGVRRAPSVANQLTTGLLGGAGSMERALQRSATRQAAAYNQAFDRTLRNFSRLGIEPRSFIAGSATAADVAKIEREFRNVEGQIGRTAVSARLFRARVGEVARGSVTSLSGLNRFVRGDLSGGFLVARQGASQIGTALADGIRRARASGRLTGVALGSTVLAGFGAVISGQQVGDGNVAGGLAGILASAIGASLATGSPIAGALVGVTGIAVAAFRSIGSAAREEAAKVAQFTDEFIRLRDEAGRIDFVADEITRQITSNLNAVQTRLIAGLGEGGLTELSSRLVAGTVDVVDVFRRISLEAGLTREEVGAFLAGVTDDLSLASALDPDFRPGDRLADFEAAQVRLADFRAALDDTGISVGDLDRVLDVLVGNNAAVAAAIGEATILNDALGESATERARKTEGAAEDEKNAIIDGLGAAKQAGIDLLSVDLSEYLDALGEFDLQAFASDMANAFGVVVDSGRNAFSNLGGIVQNTLSSLTNIVPDFRDAVSDARIDAAQQRLDTFLADLDTGVEDSTDSTGRLASGVDLVSSAIQELNSRRTSGINAQIEATRSRLQAAEEAATNARDSLTNFLTGGYADTAKASVDNLIGQVGSIGSAIEEALQQGGVRGEAALRSAVGGFEGQIARIIQQGFDDGLRTQAEFAQLLAPLRQALNEEVGDSAARILSTRDFDFGINARAGDRLQGVLERALAGNQVEVATQAVVNAEANVARIQNELDGYQLNVDSSVTFDAAQVRQALAEAGLDAAFLAQVDLSNVGAQQQSGLAGAVSTFEAQQAAQAATAPQPGATQQTYVDQSQTTIQVTETASARRTAREVILAKSAASAGRGSARHVFAV